MKVPVLETIYDRLFNCNPRRVANTVMKVMNTLQNVPADEQLAAAAVLMLVVTRRFGIEPANALNCVDNMMKDARRYDAASFKGVAEYFKNEV